MKVLRLYDHLGVLKREWNIYVVGNDFKWEASVPEVFWLGTISLEELDKVPTAEPTPEAEAVTKITPQLEELEEGLNSEGFPLLMPELLPEPVPEPEPEKPDTPVKCLSCGWTGSTKDCQFGHNDFYCPECNKENLEEVKHEPKEVHGKRSRVKRAKASSDDKSTKVIPQDNNGGNAHKRNKGS